MVQSSAALPNITYLYPAGAQRGTSVEVTAAGNFDKWPVKVWASDKGVTVEPGKDKGKLSVTVAADAVPGVYWLRAFNDDGASGMRPFVVGMLPELAEKEPNDDPKTAQKFDGSAVVNGRLEKPGDVDCFAVSLKKGQTLVASLEANSTLKSPMDALLQIVSADGFVLDQNNDFRGLDPQLAFTAPKDGTYIARVFAFPSMPDSSIRFAGADTFIYRLTLTTGGFADYPLPLAVSAEKPGSVAVVGWNIPDSARKLPVPAAGDTATLFHPGIANPFRVRLEPHSCFDFTTPPESQPKLVPPFSVTGRLTAGSESIFPVVGRKGQALSLQVQSRSLGLAVNPIIRVLDSEKKLLARAEPPKLSSDTTLSFTPPADGPFWVAVGDLFNGGGQRHVFLLRVVAAEPDYDLSVTSDRFAVPPGKSADIPVKVTRKNGFTKPVEVVAEGLPEGVKLEVKPPAGKADPNTVVVTLSAEKPSAGGAFRLVGRVKDEPATARTARAPLPDFEETTADLWVTVTDAPTSQPPPKKKKE
ncbi:MAG TPA: PPC domain-containing protein [Gemmataceae bacterium]|nr:PPC domain-containing protein [Gemmataceae bacterium]